METIIKAYKIMEKHEDKVRTLFHGINKSKTIPYDVWLESEEKIVSDGVGTKYMSGFHVLLEYEKATAYLKRFKSRLDKLVVVPVIVKDIRPKEHSRGGVYLAKFMKIKENCLEK